MQSMTNTKRIVMFRLPYTASKLSCQRNTQECVKPGALFRVSFHRLFLYTRHLLQLSLQTQCSEPAFPRALLLFPGPFQNLWMGFREAEHTTAMYGEFPMLLCVCQEVETFKRTYDTPPHTQIKGWKSSLWTVFLAPNGLLPSDLSEAMLLGFTSELKTKPTTVIGTWQISLSGIV